MVLGLPRNLSCSVFVVWKEGLLSSTQEKEKQQMMREKLTLIKIFIENSKYWWGCGETGTLVHPVVMANSKAAVENIVAVPENWTAELQNDPGDPLLGENLKELKQSSQRAVLHTCSW